MARSDISAYTAARIAESATQPVYFAYFDWGAGVRVSSADVDITDTGASVTYLGRGILVGAGSANELGNGYQITAPDVGNVFSNAINTEGIGVAMTLKKAFFNTRAWSSINLTTDGVTLLDGVVVGVPRIRQGMHVVLDCAPAIRARLIPHIICGKPTNNWNVPPGTVVRGWYTEIEVVE